MYYSDRELHKMQARIMLAFYLRVSEALSVIITLIQITRFTNYHYNDVHPIVQYVPL